MDIEKPRKLYFDEKVAGPMHSQADNCVMFSESTPSTWNGPTSSAVGNASVAELVFIYFAVVYASG